jgi:hypothetical protein
VTKFLKLKLDSKFIFHTWPTLDRCCKLHGKSVIYDGIDNIPRIPCDMSRGDFYKEYVGKREPVMLQGCQNDWKAKNWTMDGNCFSIIKFEQIFWN